MKTENMYAINVSRKFRKQWESFYLSVEKVTEIDFDPFGDKVENAVDFALLNEHRGHNFSWEDEEIYFETKEDATAFILRFSA